MAIVDKSSKLFSCNDGEGCEAQVRDYLVANKDVIVRPTGKDGRIERFGKDESILRGSGAHLERGGRVTFYPNVAKKGRMWHFWTIL